MAARPGAAGVRGLVVGRTLLYPPDDDVARRGRHRRGDGPTGGAGMSAPTVPSSYVPAGTAAASGYDLEITPATAGWTYSSLRVADARSRRSAASSRPATRR